VVHYSFGAIVQTDFIVGLPSAGSRGFFKECSLNRFRAALRNGLFVPGHQSLTKERTRADVSTRFRTYGFRSPEGRFCYRRFAPNAPENALSFSLTLCRLLTQLANNSSFASECRFKLAIVETAWGWLRLRTMRNISSEPRSRPVIRHITGR
jgi:hypothetical protein